jgi:hypothetical protein
MTELTVLQGELSRLLPNIKLAFEEPMAKHTSFRIGGPAEVMAFPENAEQLAEDEKLGIWSNVEEEVDERETKSEKAESKLNSFIEEYKEYIILIGALIMVSIFNLKSKKKIKTKLKNKIKKDIKKRLK